MKIGDKFKISDCGHKGRVIGLSDDGKTAYVQCNKEHEIDPITKKPYGEATVWEKGGPIRMRIKKRDIVYEIDVSDIVS
jgi:hypothetical protein